MNWDDVRVFLAVVRNGQLLGAARALGINHATAARRIDALEAALSTTLLVRRTNGTSLSAEGERFLPFAERMESEMLAAQEAVAARDLALSGTVRIGAPDGFGVGYLAPRLGALAEQHPGLRLELVPVPRTFSLSRREADIAVTLELPREGRLKARKLVDYTLGLYASAAYLANRPAPATTEELRQHRLVGYVDDLIFSPALDYTTEVLKGWTSDLSVSSALGQFEAVRAGAGIGILHSFMARRDATLQRVLPEIVLQRAYWLVVHEDLRALRRVAVVADYLAGIVAADRAIFS
ncbi:LysR family transcriptional regulator [Devosia sp. Root413D1]|uniref:LysR family transcriptional regulator n=1 Tax=Devosia sp. Root413D1 TaxID=1736531 RepID=UPI000700BEF7|nr:LysR family transcriptional regulator [Devosia sp. Root413D1]KQW86114.1 LysR family transcriptional regulator [Devosia sp. Root413D1]